ncbi:unnamed protein product [Choristocarpus tenellus]
MGTSVFALSFVVYRAYSMGRHTAGPSIGDSKGIKGCHREDETLREGCISFSLGEMVAPRSKSFLYTRAGDKGTSSLFNLEKRSKGDAAFEALGSMDELNASLGVAVEHCRLAGNGLAGILREVQSLLIDASALVATPRSSSTERKIARTQFPSRCTTQLEASIDELDARLPQLKTFILPGGGLAASHLHLSRCVCRRAERSLQPLLADGQGVEEVARFVNRLSDFLFAAARYASLVEGNPERS